MKRVPFDWEKLQVRTSGQLRTLEAIADGPFGYVYRGTRIVKEGGSRRVVGWFSWFSNRWLSC